MDALAEQVRVELRRPWLCTYSQLSVERLESLISSCLSPQLSVFVELLHVVWALSMLCSPLCGRSILKALNTTIALDTSTH